MCARIAVWSVLVLSAAAADRELPLLRCQSEKCVESASWRPWFAYSVEGETCSYNDSSGVCAKITECVTILEHPIVRKFSPACQTFGLIDIVCCNRTQIQSAREDLCEPIPPSLTSTKTGNKAWDKCIDFQQLMFPCKDGIRLRRCSHDAASNYDRSSRAGRYEFPHAVLLGYTNDQNRLDWLCGGTLVSERFVLTAAHCVANKPRSPIVTHVAINPSDRSNIAPDSIQRVKNVVRHPDYRPPKTYHDIALLELEQPLTLSPTLVPACLVADEPPMTLAGDQFVIATSWNTHDVLETGITWLRKFQLSRYSIAECSQFYPENHRRGGYNDTTQLCYGSRERNPEICQDDGGNPVLVSSQRLSCVYGVAGLASYGRGCFAHGPGVYTRVEPYLSWIEGVVWP